MQRYDRNLFEDYAIRLINCFFRYFKYEGLLPESRTKKRSILGNQLTHVAYQVK